MAEEVYLCVPRGVKEARFKEMQMWVAAKNTDFAVSSSLCRLSYAAFYDSKSKPSMDRQLPKLPRELYSLRGRQG